MSVENMTTSDSTEPPIQARSTPWFASTLHLRCPLVEALPFPPGVSPRLQALQRFIETATDDTADIGLRAEAFESLDIMLIECGCEDSESLKIRESVHIACTNTAGSAVLTLVGVQIVLERAGQRLNAGLPINGSAYPLFISTSAEKCKGSIPPPAVIQRCEEVLTQFSSMDAQQLQFLGPHECTACITLLIVFLQGDETSLRSRRHPDNPSLTHAALLNLWLFLLTAIPQPFKLEKAGFEVRYGPAAIQTVKHRISKTLVISTENAVQAQSMRNDGDAASLIGTALGPTHVVVAGVVAPGSDVDSRTIISRLANLSQPLPVAFLPSREVLEAVQSKLIGEFPWAEGAVRQVLGELITKRLFGAHELVFSPVLLLGPPGVGKTRLVRRFAEELQIPFMALGLAGMDDSRAILGTSRGWTSAQPAPIVEFLSSQRSASALILLDEVDKVTNRSTNSTPPTIALLALLELESARRFFDGFLQTAVDLSKVIFVATANAVDGIPGPLLSRMRPCVVGRPSDEHMINSIAFAAQDIAKDWAVDHRRFPPISASLFAEAPINMRHLKTLIKNYLVKWAAENRSQFQVH